MTNLFDHTFNNQDIVLSSYLSRHWDTSRLFIIMNWLIKCTYEMLV